MIARAASVLSFAPGWPSLPRMSEKRPKASAKTTFESEFQRLEEVVRGLESGEVPLAELISRYEDGMARLKACREFLADAELRLEQLRAGGETVVVEAISPAGSDR